MMQAQQLQCIRDDRILFDHLDFELAAGDILQIGGRNGSGKTSLLRILCGLALPTEGQVLWQGQDIHRNNADFRANLNYVGHLAGIKADLTPLENLRIAQHLSHTQTDIDLAQALDKVGLYGFEDVPTRSLSAGQQRRVAIARLLVRNAPLWILDEPFTALDKHAVSWLEELLDAHTQQGGLVILTSHQTVNCQQLRWLELGA